MTKRLLLISTVLVIAHVVFGQRTIGFKAGINVSYQQRKLTPPVFPTDKTENTKALPGCQFGVFYKVKVSKKWNLSSELNFSLIGSKLPYITMENWNDSAFSVHQFNSRIGYLEVPLSAQYNIQNFYFGIGSGVAFKLFTNKLDSVYMADYKVWDLSANMLAGYKIGKNLDVNLRYSHGLLNILSNKHLYGGYSYASMQNRYFNLSVLYTLK